MTVSDADAADDANDDAWVNCTPGALLASLDVADEALGDLTTDDGGAECDMCEAKSASEAAPARPAGVGEGCKS